MGSIGLNEEDELFNNFYFIFTKVKENYDILMTPSNLEIINSNSMKNKFMVMGFEEQDATIMTLSFMFIIYLAVFSSL